MARPEFEQHIALFGESGSGKTVLLSSFFGRAQEPSVINASRRHLVPESRPQGNKLHSYYLGMKNSATLPPANRFSWDSYTFDLKLKLDASDGGGTTDALRLVWHDYPGEWFEGRREGARERERQTAGFRALLESDVAFLLVDGQKLLDHRGEEERYLKYLFTSFRNTLLAMRTDILDDGKRLVEFPRIWFIALSKSDLNPDLDVYRFRDLVIEKSADELDLLREVLASFVVAPEALAVGEDFLMLSSGTFAPGEIHLERRVGLDVIMPIAAMLPFERHIRWATKMKLPAKVADELRRNSKLIGKILAGAASRWPRPVAKVVALIGPSVIAELAELAGRKLRDLNSSAVSRGDLLASTLSQFKIDLEDAEESVTLIRGVS